MSQKRRVFKRTEGIRAYKKLYIIVAEGSKTERKYTQDTSKCYFWPIAFRTG